MREFDDAAFKRWFDHKRMVEDLLRGFAPAAEALDFATLEQLPAEYADDDLSRSRADAVWRVRFREASAGWLYLLVLLEFQSTVDRHMAARILAYTARMYLKLIRGGELPSGGKLPPVLPVVIYNGERRWWAPVEVGETIASAGPALGPFQPRQRYLLIDEHALRVEDLPADNVVSAQIELEQGSISELGPVLQRLSVLLSSPEHASLRRAFAELTRHMVSRSASARSHPELASALRAAEETGGLSAMGSLLATRIDEYIEASVAKGIEERLAQGVPESSAEFLAESIAKGVERGRAEALEQGLARQRMMLVRQASRKFGAGTESRLTALLAEVADAKRLAEIGDLVIDCADGAELLARAEAAAQEG